MRCFIPIFTQHICFMFLDNNTLLRTSQRLLCHTTNQDICKYPVFVFRLHDNCKYKYPDVWNSDRFSKKQFREWGNHLWEKKNYWNCTRNPTWARQLTFDSRLHCIQVFTLFFFNQFTKYKLRSDGSLVFNIPHCKLVSALGAIELLCQKQFAQGNKSHPIFVSYMLSPFLLFIYLSM